MVTSNQSSSQASAASSSAASSSPASSSPATRARGVTVPAPDLDTLLGMPAFFVSFYKFSKTEFSSENIGFLNAVNQFKRMPSLVQARTIYKNYITISGEKRININSSNKKSLDVKFSDTESLVVAWDISSVFDDAKKEIIVLLNNDTYKRFKKTPEYKNIMKSLGHSV